MKSLLVRSKLRDIALLNIWHDLWYVNWKYLLYKLLFQILYGICGAKVIFAGHFFGRIWVQWFVYLLSCLSNLQTCMSCFIPKCHLFSISWLGNDTAVHVY